MCRSLWEEVDNRQVVQQDREAWLAFYRLLAVLQASCRTLRDLVRSPGAEGFWTELCVGCWHNLGPQEALMRGYVERNACRARNVSVFGDHLPLEHLSTALTACTSLARLDMHGVDSIPHVEEITRALALSAALPTAAGVHSCALGAQLPSSVTELMLSPTWSQEDNDGEGWGWYMQGLDMQGEPAFAGWVLHR